MVIVRVMYVRMGKKRNECVYARLGSISLTRIVCVCVVRERGKRPVKLLLVCNETLNNAKYHLLRMEDPGYGKVVAQDIQQLYSSCILLFEEL